MSSGVTLVEQLICLVQQALHSWLLSLTKDVNEGGPVKDIKALSAEAWNECVSFQC